MVLSLAFRCFPGAGVVLLAAAFAQAADVRFEDVAHESGLRFVLDNHATAEKHMIETMPGGLAVFDFDGDGLPDVFFTNGAEIPSLKKTGPKYWNRLFRNEGGGTFRDVTEEAGLPGVGYSMGAAAADFDNDDHPDLFVAGVYRNLLYRNNGDGRFTDVTAASGINSESWSVAAGWFDYDNDGLLDLFVVNYSEWSAENSRFCGDRTRNLRVYCHPKYFDPVPSQLYRNLGHGKFVEVSEASGIAKHAGRGMSVAFADFDGDGFQDAFVTNDNLPNFLFRNQGDGTFTEEALLAGTALLDHGRPVASMGADFRDYDNDALPDVFVTALNGETYPLFRNDGGGMFLDATYASGIASGSASFGGWSVGLFDFNNDGWKDLFTANSHVNDIVEKFEAAEYKQRNSVFVNRGDGTFEVLSEKAGFTHKRAHRGSGFADFDGDGKIDVVVSALGQPAELWRNVSPGENHWLIVKLAGTKSNRDAIGAVVQVDGQTNQMTSSVGYASSSLFGVHFGLGSSETANEIRVRWPNGAETVRRDIAADQVITIGEE